MVAPAESVSPQPTAGVGNGDTNEGVVAPGLPSGASERASPLARLDLRVRDELGYVRASKLGALICCST